MRLSRDEVADRLRRDIASGVYKPGHKLPPQRDLATMLGTAPNTVGAAMKALAAEGLIELRDKARAVVGEPGKRIPTAEGRIDATRTALLQVQAGMREVRDRLGELEGQVADALSKLNG